MVDSEGFLGALARFGVQSYFGVPDSLLSSLIVGLEARAEQGNCLLEIAADEGAAVGLAIGQYLGTRAPSVVFMQNSGLGNAVNPLTSLASPKVYGIPMLLLVGWRGEMTALGQIKDEPQHVFQGEITCEVLDILDIPYRVIGPDDALGAAHDAAEDLLRTAMAETKPTALVIRKNTFSTPTKPPQEMSDFPLREEAIKCALTSLGDMPLVGTTGKISREVYELQQGEGLGGPSFLSVGGMGHAAMIATGIALGDPARKVACLDGDGAILMHTGSLATSARQANLIHIVFNNQVHDSVGGQVTAGPDAKLTEVAKGLGYKTAQRITRLADIGPALEAAKAADHASFVEIMVAPGARSDLGRPKATPAESKTAFMAAIGRPHD